MQKEKSYQLEKKVILELIGKIVEEVDGIHSIKRGLWGKNIKFRENPEGIDVSLGLIIKRGVSIPLVAEELQRKVKEELEKTLATPVKRIKVVIKGIRSSS